MECFILGHCLNPQNTTRDVASPSYCKTDDFQFQFITDPHRKEWTGNVGTICSISQWESLVWLGRSKYTNYHFNFAKFIFALSSRPVGWQKLDRMLLMDYTMDTLCLTCVQLSILSSCQALQTAGQCCRLVRDAAVWTRSQCYCRDCSITAVPSSHEMLQRNRNCSRVWGPAGVINMILTLFLKIDDLIRFK